MKNKFIIVSLAMFALMFCTCSALAGTATVSWNANTESDLAGYKVYYGTSARTASDPKTCSLCGYTSVINVGNVLSYVFDNLTDGVTYYFSVSALDTSNNESVFSTQVSKAIPPAMPVISNLVGSGTTANSTTISWDTNVLTNGQVFYGLTSGYGSQSLLLDNTVKITSHSTTLLSLSPSTTYHFKVTSTDAGSNSVSSSDFTFTTLSSAVTFSGGTTSSNGGGGEGGAATAPGVTIYIPAAVSMSSGTTTSCLTSQTTGTSPPALTHNLYRSLKSNDVKILQTFLFNQNYITADSITSFFGPLTEKAAQAFQKANNIVSTGSPSTTGYGSVGPKTRAKINSMLNTTFTSCTAATPTASTQSLQDQIKALQTQVNALLLKMNKTQ